MRTSIEIQSEISETETRLASIELELTTARQAEEAAREAVTSGSGDMADLERALSASSARQSVQSTLATRLEALTSELQAAQAHEAREATLQRAAELAADAEKQWGEYRTAYDEAMAKFPELAAKIADAQDAHWKTCCAFNALPNPTALTSELAARQIPTTGLCAVPLDGRVFPFSQGGDIRKYHGKAAPALTQMLLILHRERANR